MVIITHYAPSVLNAYSTVPLTQSIIDTTQHGFYDGTSARFGDPEVVVDIHNRTDFHGYSHYQLRRALDAEGALFPFVILDEHTPELDAVWYVETTARCQYWDTVVEGTITYPYENFTLWQIHIRVADLPISTAAWSVHAGSMLDIVPGPYDPHDPQPNTNFYYKNHRILNWTDPSQFLWGGNLRVTANSSEVMWRRNSKPAVHVLPPTFYEFSVSLTEKAARKNGFLPYWNDVHAMPPPGDEVELTAKCDWDSPLWPKGYPDDPGVVSRVAPSPRLRQADARPLPRLASRPHLIPGDANRTRIEFVGPPDETYVSVSDAIHDA
ncbi:MAG: hypothetical protein Q9215_001089 [Flavoplaca cf. flavocitrina]